MGVTNRADNEHELQDLFFFFLLGSPPPSNTSPRPPSGLMGGPPASDRLRNHWAVLEENPDEHRDGHTVYNPAPHLGYELANQGG